MQILFLTQIIPYPPDAGPKVKTWHVLRYLASRGYQVTLASFVLPEEEEVILTVTDIDSSSKSAVSFTIPITGTGGGFTQTTSVKLLYHGEQTFLPLVFINNR